MQLSRSKHAQAALGLVESLQARFVFSLEGIARAQGEDRSFGKVTWLRDEGSHGGGWRAVAPAESRVFNRGSVNVSQVHYDDLPDRRLRAATALSTIIHPRHPRCPSVHIHLSYTEMRSEPGYWRIMADLNPAIEAVPDTARFAQALRRAAGDLYDAAARQGDRYFHIPAAGRHRGVVHFYLEAYRGQSFDADFELTKSVGETAIDTYIDILSVGLEEGRPVVGEDSARQLEYHSLYFFQVLTLDRGTTSGLLVHNQNDVGILGSLPSHVDRAHVEALRAKVPTPQDELVDGLLEALPHTNPAPVGEAEKVKLAEAVRAHYRKHPQALDLQATGGIVPPTVANHSTTSR